MVIELLQTIFWIVSMGGKLIVVVVFKGGALLMELGTRILQIPWAGLLEVLSLVVTVIRAAAEWFIESFVHWFLSFLVDLVRLFPRAASVLVRLVSDSTGLVAETWHRVEDQLGIPPNAFNNVIETVHSIFQALIHNYRRAVDFVAGNR